MRTTTAILISAISALALASPAAAKCKGEGKHDPMSLKTICDLERAWGQSSVKADPTLVQRLFADDFVGVSPKGKLYRKTDETADISNPSPMASDVLNDVVVRFYGDTAVAQGSDSWIGRDGRKGSFVWTDVWLRRNGSWQIVAAEDLIPPEGK